MTGARARMRVLERGHHYDLAAHSTLRYILLCLGGDMMVEARAEEGKLTRRGVWKDLIWFPTLFAAVVGAPSLLSLLEMVRDYRLSGAFQWIVDGYHRITTVMAHAIEPLVM